MAFTVQNRPVGDFANWVAPNVFGSAFVEVVTGDFNGDRATDLALVNHDAGWNTVPVALSTPSGFTVQNRFVGDFAAWAASYRVEPLTGDFNGDGRADLALVNHDAGWNTVPVALATANGFDVQNRPAADFAGWAAIQGPVPNYGSWIGSGRISAVEPLTGDFNGDGRTDIALVNHGPGWNTVPVALSGPNGFTVQNRSVGDFATWAASPGVQPLTGDFNRDGLTDIALINHAAGWNTVPVALARPNGFTIENRPVGEFAAWAAVPNVEPLVGDFNGDRRADIALINHGPGWNTVPVALATASGFTIQNRPVGEFAAWAASNSVQAVVNDFNRDGRSDIGLVNHAGGWITTPVALSGPDGFAIHNEYAGEFAGWAATAGVEVLAGDFSGDGAGDLALVNHLPGWNTVPVSLWF